MRTVTFFVDGRPKSTQSGSVIRDKKSGRLYPTRRNSEWAATFGQCAREHRLDSLMTGPVEVTFRVYMQRPQVWREYPTVSPDWDNLTKGLGDKLNGVLWVDDRQIVKAHVEKLYHPDGRVGIEVTVTELPEMERPARKAKATSGQAALLPLSGGFS